MKKFNWLGLLSLLALLTVLAPVTGETGYYGFLGFAVYFKYFFVIPDELFCANVRKAATPAFFVNVFLTMGCVGLKGLGMGEAAVTGSILSFCFTLILFTLLMVRYEWKEQRGGMSR